MIPAKRRGEGGDSKPLNANVFRDAIDARC